MKGAHALPGALPRHPVTLRKFKSLHRLAVVGLLAATIHNVGYQRASCCFQSVLNNSLLLNECSAHSDASFNVICYWSWDQLLPMNVLIAEGTRF